jgi:hypothetical protein
MTQMKRILLGKLVMSHLIKIFQDVLRRQSVTAVSISLSTALRAYHSVCDNPSLAGGHL